MKKLLVLAAALVTAAGISVAVVWHFTQQVHPEIVPATDHPSLVALSASAEAIPEFLAAPHSDATYRDAG